jgi:hypothetical protein
VEHEMYDHTSNNWSHRISNKRFKEKFEGHTRQNSIIRYKRQLYLERHMCYRKYCSLKLEV